MLSSQVINYPHPKSHVEIIRYRKQYKIRNSTRPDEVSIQYTRSGSTAVSPINLLLPSPSPSQTSTSKETQLLYIPRIQNPSISGQRERPDFRGIFHCPLMKGAHHSEFLFSDLAGRRLYSVCIPPSTVFPAFWTAIIPLLRMAAPGS